MSHRVYAVAAYTTGALASGAAIVAAQGALWWYAGLLILAGSVLYGLGERHRDAHRAAVEARRAREQQVRAMVLSSSAVAAAMAAMGHAARDAGRGIAQMRADLDKEHRP